MVDDFEIKYTNKDDIKNLFKAIIEKYPLKIDWTGNKYVRIDRDWDYGKKRSKVSHEGIRQTSTTTIPTPYTNKASLLTYKIRTASIWKENKIQYQGHIT